MKNLFFIILVLLCHPSGAQQEKKFRWSSTIKAGLMYGETTDNFHAEAMTGVKYETWQLTAGAGVDCYYWRSVPLFINLSKDLMKRQRTPFISCAAGTNLPWIKNQDDIIWEEYKYHKGFYGMIEAGYRMPVNIKTSLSLSIGYSQKNLHADKIYYGIWNPVPPHDKVETSREYYSYRFNRLSFSAALTF